MTSVEIPFAKLSAEALAGLVGEFVTRNGTDYGEREVSLESKRAAVMRQLERGEVLIAFDLESETSTIVRREDWVP